MKLDKTNRDSVIIGTILESRGDRVQVMNVQPAISRYRTVQGKYLTIKWLDSPSRNMIGRVATHCSLSDFYGWEIVG